MKSAKKMIVAAGFVSLFFAPLAQAQSATIEEPADGTGGILFGVVESSVIVVATPINFGAVAPSVAGPSNSVEINLTCGAPDTVSSATARAIMTNNANPVSCGTITVSARGTGTSYHLRVDVEELQLAGDNPSAATAPSIAPTLVVIDGSNQPVGGLDNISSSSTTSARGSVSESGVKTYKVRGSMIIPANQAEGNYRGEYTVAAIVQ